MLYEPELSVEVNWGALGEVYEKNDAGVMVWRTFPEGKTTNDVRIGSAIGDAFPSAILNEYYDTVVEYPQDAANLYQQKVDYYFPHMNEEYLPVDLLLFSDDDFDELNQIQTELYAYVNLKRAEFLSEGGIEEEWNQFKAELDKMGLKRMLEIVQDAYDDYLAALD